MVEIIWEKTSGKLDLEENSNFIKENTEVTGIKQQENTPCRDLYQ